MPPQASEFAEKYDWLFWVTSALTAIFTGIVLALIFYLSIKYRHGAKVNRRNAPDHNTPLEVTWSVIPGILGIAIFFWATFLFAEAKSPPKDAMEIFVIGKQWMWHAEHQNGVRENNELHVPVGVPVKLTMISQDVIHSFFIPAFRAKMDVVPGRYTSMWFKPTKPGRYYLFCAEMCGTQHSEMVGYVTVMPKDEFAQWLQNGGTKFEPPAMTMVGAGKRLYEKFGCGNCHGAKDSESGPSLYAIYGKLRPIKGQAPVVADDMYLRESILDPHKKLTSGYDKTMGEYKGILTEEEVLQLNAYIKSLGAQSNAGVASTDATKTNE